MADKKSFILYTDSIDIVEFLPDEEAGQLFKALMAHANGIEVGPMPAGATVAFMSMSRQIDRDNAKYESKCEANRRNGKKGGRPPITERLSDKPNETERLLEEPSITQANPTEPNITLTDTDTDTDTVTDTVTDTDTIKRKKPTRKETKKVYGSFENVKLTDSEYSKLMSDYPNITDDYIERVSTYIAQKGDKYKSHYATILTWIRRDGETAASQPKQVCGNPFLQLLKDEGVYEQD